MPAPRLGPGGVGRLGGALYDELAARELQRLKMAAAAELARQQHFKEGIELRTASRDDLKQQLADKIEQRNAAEFQDKIAHPTPLSVSGSVSPFGSDETAFINPRDMTRMGGVPTYLKPKDPVWRDDIDVNGVRSDALTDEHGNIVATLKKAPKEFAPPTPQEPSWGVPVNITGPDGNPTAVRFNNRGGMMPLPGVELAGPPGPPSTAEYETLKFYRRMSAGSEIMDAYEPQLTGKDWTVIHEMPDWSATLKTAALSPAGQAWMQGARDFLMAHGRDESGKAISKQEWQDFKTQVVPVATETAEARKLKRYSRDVMIDVSGFAAGRAYREYYKTPYAPRGRPTVPYTYGADGQLRPAGSAAPAPGAAPPRLAASHGAAAPTITFDYDASGRLVQQP